MKQNFKGSSAFSVILINVVVALLGLLAIPMLNVRYAPQVEENKLNVSFSYYNASARVLENEVTSKLEGALSTVDGLEKVKANSAFGNGEIELIFNEDKDLDVARFEVANQVRRVYSELPQGVSYPYISASSQNDDAETVLSYRVNANLSTRKISEFINERYIPALSKIEGVESIRLSSAVPYEWRITFDPDQMKLLGIRVEEIQEAFSLYFREDLLGFTPIGEQVLKHNACGSASQSIGVSLKVQRPDDIHDFIVTNKDGRNIYLRDIADVSYSEAAPQFYYRINGLNTINLSVNAAESVNTLTLVEEVKAKMSEMKSNMVDFDIAYDASVDLKKEINKILYRSLLSLAILLVFVLLVSRSFKYLAVIFTSIFVNLLSAMILYAWADIQINTYSMAGITISFGIIIDTVIVMVDHYTYYRNRRVFTSILGAIVTTIASLSLIFLMSNEVVDNFADFIWVIIINLSISLLVSLFFVPALLEKVQMLNQVQHDKEDCHSEFISESAPAPKKGIINFSIKRRRRIVKFSRLYQRYIVKAKKYRWAYILGFILLFGIPIHLLPNKIEEKRGEELGFWATTYNKTIGGDFYSENRKIFEKILGGSFRLFSENISNYGYYREPQVRKTLSARAVMPEGATIHQLNAVMQSMENYLSQFPEIDIYTTRIYSGGNGNLSITFKKEYEDTYFPLDLKQQIIQKAISFGGASWYVYGIDDKSFNNHVYSGGYSHSINITGYNYDNLYRWAEEVQKELKKNPRIKETEIQSGRSGYYYGASGNRSEYFINYDNELIAHSGTNLNAYYSFLREQLYESNLGRYYINGESVNVKLSSKNKDAFDLWHIQNDMVDIDSVKTRLTDIGSVEKRKSGNEIYRENNEYSLNIAYNFLGTYKLEQRIRERIIDDFNDTKLPMGYKLKSREYNWGSSEEQAKQFYLVLLIIAVIFAICLALFESFRKALAIVLLIPFGLIGLFLTFGIGGFTFDQGGFAAIVMLTGLVVNAGIYLVSEYNTVLQTMSARPESKQCGEIGAAYYLKAYNRKIIPTLLTIVSTVLGLLPFLFDGQSEVFWFPFAVGVMGGMIFSVLGLVLVFPVFLLHKK